jgi:hypothetical protein
MGKLYCGSERWANVRRFLLPLLLVPVVSGVLGAFRPQILTAGFMSWRAFAVTAGVGVAGLLALALVWRRSRLAALWTADLVVLALMAAVVWPVFRERTVNEAFPPLAMPLASRDPGPSASWGASVFPKASATPGVAFPIRSGGLHGIGHHAHGTVSLYAVGGEIRLRFEHVAIEGTPTPSVHLVAPGKHSPKGGLRLGGLKAEKGSFSYVLPNSFDASAPRSVLVWCDRYAVPIAAADLA